MSAWQRIPAQVGSHMCKALRLRLVLLGGLPHSHTLALDLAKRVVVDVVRGRGRVHNGHSHSESSVSRCLATWGLQGGSRAPRLA
eukprot:1096840-Prymnesium_polylepis.1